MINVPPIPNLILIGDRFSRPDVSNIICTAVESGVPWVHLRDHQTDAHRFEMATFDLVDRLRAISKDVRISINTNVQVAMKLSVPAFPVVGIHLGRRGPSVENTRQYIRADTPVGISVHSIGEVCGGGIDYYLWSPVFPTKSKPGNAGTGLKQLAAAVNRAETIPVIAMGGISPDNASRCIDAGAHGIAVLSGILQSENVPGAVENYLAAIKSS